MNCRPNLTVNSRTWSYRVDTVALKILNHIVQQIFLNRTNHRFGVHQYLFLRPILARKTKFRLCSHETK